MLTKKKYPSKVLLFGEYTVIHDSNAVAAPSNLFSGYWDFDKKEASNQSVLSTFHEYLSSSNFEDVVYQVSDFKGDLDQHLIFNSSIPIGYGLGSSGAVCAAVFDQYFQKENALPFLKLKNILGQMESFFHGSSSGFDPLISYLGKPILISKGKAEMTSLPNHSSAFQLFLLDTGLSRRTEPLVNSYLERFQTDSSFRKAIEEELSPFNNLTIQHYLKSNWSKAFQEFHNISLFQWQHFQKMIPKSSAAIWQQGLDSNFFKIKLCGAGGGGFLIGATNDWERIKTMGYKNITLLNV